VAKKLRRDFGFASAALPDAAECCGPGHLQGPFWVDFVAKVENRTTQKIS
jgi:hypothetical protein